VAKIEVEIGDNGDIGTLPDPIQKFLDGRINDAFKRGAEKVEKELKEKGALTEVERQKLKSLEEENSRHQEAEAKRNGEHQKAIEIAEKRHADAIRDRDEKLTARDAEIARRTDRLRASLKSDIRAAATAAGARADSLPELEKLLGAEVDLDDKLEAFVKDDKGQPKLGKDNKPITIEGLVQQYLLDHPHHLSTRRGQNGKAAGGLTFAGGKVGGTEVDQAAAELAAQPTVQNLTRMVSASRKRAS
jgi:hypothetical protein